jgi:hypothetical protein
MCKFIGISKITVRNFASVVKQSIDIKPITLLLGRNNSGKSNMMYPLAWLTSMLEKYSSPVCSWFEEDDLIESWEQINPKIVGTMPNQFSIEIENELGSVDLSFCKPKNEKDGNVRLELIRCEQKGFTVPLVYMRLAEQKQGQKLSCYLSSVPKGLLSDIQGFSWSAAGARNFCNLRQYRQSDTCKSWCGFLCEDFASTVVERWQKSNDDRLCLLVQYLQKMGLCDNIEIWANPDDEAKEDDGYKIVELRTLFYHGVFNHAGKPGVHLRYVGDGLTQIFSVLVSLIAAEPNQVVYLEHPDMVLHPSAHSVLVEAIVDSMKRGVRVVVETHSGLLLSLLQISAVTGSFYKDVVLHWFSRGENGQTEIIHGGLDEFGSYGDLPIDLPLEKLLFDYSKPLPKTDN